MRRVSGTGGDRLDGWLVQPIDLAGRPVVTAPASIAGFDALRNWRVDLGERSFGPDEAAELDAALATIEASAGESPGEHAGERRSTS